MYKNISFLVFIAISVFFGFWLFPQPAKIKTLEKITTPIEQTQNSASTPQITPSASIAQQTKNGIDIVVTQINQENDATIIDLTLNNHQFNLADDTIYNNATLNGQLSRSHTFKTNAAGGHHAEVTVVFPKTTTGSLVLTPVENIIFTFDNLWK